MYKASHPYYISSDRSILTVGGSLAFVEAVRGLAKRFIAFQQRCAVVRKPHPVDLRCSDIAAEPWGGFGWNG